MTWQRVALPDAGGVQQQPARTMEALTLVGRLKNDTLRRAQAGQRT